jgi:hypothetical protein
VINADCRMRRNRRRKARRKLRRRGGGAGAPPPPPFKFWWGGGAVGPPTHSGYFLGCDSGFSCFGAGICPCSLVGGTMPLILM